MTKEQKEAIKILRIAKGDEKTLHVYQNTLNKAIETVLSMLEEKDKIISLMLEKFADIDFDNMCLDCECCVGNGCVKEERDLYENCIKQYFENKAKESE